MEGRLQLGLLDVLEQRPDDARVHYRNASQDRPDALPAIRRIGEFFARDGRWTEAAMQYGLYLEFAPDDLAARAERAVALALAQRPAEAAAEYQEILRRKPDWPEVLNNLAWLRATHPQAEARDGAEAIQLAERACELTQRQQAVFLGTLAAAYAEAGRFAVAIKTAETARELALANHQEKLRRRTTSSSSSTAPANPTARKSFERPHEQTPAPVPAAPPLRPRDRFWNSVRPRLAGGRGQRRRSRKRCA
jgi:tetratricopeptide (TPR) repeat protein